MLFEAPEAADLIGYFVQAVSGGSLYRKSSFLPDSLGNAIFAPHMNLREEPHLPRAAAVRRSTAKAWPPRPRDVVRDGVVQGYFLGSLFRAQAGTRRRPAMPAAATTWCCAHGPDDLPALLRRMGRGLLVTEQLGHGVNPVTGDFSRGAAGFWIENGQIAYPVEEITIAGNLSRCSATSSPSAATSTAAARAISDRYWSIA